ncbi:PREDICTED: interleukin-20 receptor subunit alpha-like [Thamnophis sirtalis]|uniref:Interleukin-20 receptor subunit alpha-like n=1 Tax=Thamnophis sirtalis TaxID=35019 RepID=A0A6I9YME5_9SAUR|nr:PREDICTED: interleukin-20 receptor subunit alpha-like [Thamnophis sirtalis]
MSDPAASALWLLLLRLIFPAPPSDAAASHCLLPSPRNVHFISRNMKNILHWLPPEGIAENKLNYKVKYLIYGTDKWIKYPECKNINQTWCDLSHGTYNHKEQYHARVKVSLNRNCSVWAESPRFNPFTDTAIDPPAFSLSSTENSISVTMVPPEKWKRNPREEPVYLHEIYSGLQYNVSVFNKNINKRWMFCIQNNRLEVQQLQPNTIYCVTVQIFITPLLFSELSEEHCIPTLKADPAFKQTATVIFGYTLPGLLLVLIILVSSCCLYRYTHLVKQTYPKNLILKYSQSCGRDNFVPSEKIVVNFITVNVVEEHKSFPENYQQRIGNGYINADTGAGNCAEEKASKKVLGNNNFLEKDNVLKDEQNRSEVKLAELESPQALGQTHNDEAVAYEFDVRTEQMTPVQEKEQIFSCICEPDCAPHNSQTELPIYGTKQDYCPQFGTQDPNTSFSQQFKEVLLNERQSASLHLYDAEVPLINLMADEPNCAFCSECDVIADICLVPEPKELLLDEKEAVLKEPHTLLSLLTQKTASKHHQIGTRSKENQETGMEDEQKKTMDWNPWTGRMYLSPLLNITKEDKIDPKNYEESLEEALLFRLYESHCSEDLLGRYENMYLLQLKEHWGLHIEMQP